MKLRLAFAAALAAVPLAIQPISAAAYDGNNAANHAETYTNSYDGQYQRFPDDCTDFSSQNLSAGGFPYVTGGSSTDDHYWWYDKNFYSNSHSWSVSTDLRTFLIWHYPGGWDYGTTTGNSNNNGYWDRWPENVGLVRGDLLFYDWGQGSGWSHNATLVVMPGYSYGNGWYGDLVDAHTSNRWHAFWDLSEYNQYLWTTNIDAMHIDPRN